MDGVIDKKTFEYMKSVNPIAQRIAEDIDIIKCNYKDWETIENKTRDQIINDKLVDPSLISKYAGRNVLQSNIEFSSNFSWFSKSQLNLFTHINVKNDKNKTPLKKSDILSPMKKNTTSTKVPFDSYKQTENLTIFSKLKNKVMRDENKSGEKIITKGVAKPKNPPPPPPSKVVSCEEKGLLEEQFSDDIPKTGFDFLDNW